jgi:outer membrane lipoprotein-sorting protein
MKPIRAFSALGILLAAAAAIAQDANLDKVLSQMDASSTKFQDMQADITADLYTAVVQDHEMQTGKTAFRRIGGSLEMITKILTDNGQPAERDILYKNGELDFYQPALKQETIFTSGANRGEYDSLLATGFGATSRDLSATWTVSFQGMETVDGVQTAKLDLVPKQANIRNSVSHITIWLDPVRDISLKQVMYQPTGDSRTVTYSNIRYNNHPSASLFTLKLASGTQVQRK